MCATLVDHMQGLDDPRLAIWANRVQVSLKVDANLPAGTDKVEGNVRYLSPDKVDGVLIDQDPEYVGMPPSWSSSVPSSYNLKPKPGQLSNNPHTNGTAQGRERASTKVK